MIDTVVLTLTSNMYTITDPDKFQPSAKWALADASFSSRGMRSIQNPTKVELKLGIYKPALTLSHRVNPFGGQQILLRVELSLPKIFYGNNFDELRSKDFPGLIKKICEVLKTMGIAITPAKLSKASISSVHYSKNIALTDGSTPYFFINKIKEANLKISLDTNQTDYRNDGHSFKWHSNSFEVVFYDKVRDLEKARLSSKRAIEKDNEVQLDIFKRAEKKKKLEILRMEVRLNKRTKIKQIFSKLEIKSDFTLKNIFKTTVSKKILLQYLDEVESKRLDVNNFKSVNDKSLLAEILFNHPGEGAPKIFRLFGLKKALESITARELRKMFSRYDDRNWYRLMAEVKKIKLPKIESPLAAIRKHLRKFKILKLEDFV